MSLSNIRFKEWADDEPLYKVNTNCPVCGTEIKCCPNGVDGSWFDKIRLCSTKCHHEFIRKIWRMALSKDKIDLMGVGEM